MSSDRRVAVLLTLLVPTLLAAGAARADDLSDSCQQGATAFRAGNLEHAGDAFSQCAASQPRFAEAYLNLGLVRIQQSRFADASAALTKALALKANLRGADLFLGIAQYRLDEYAPSAETLKQAVALEPANPTALMWLGMAQLANNDAPAAVASLEKGSKLQPQDVDILYHLGRAYMQLSKLTYQRMYEADPNSWRVHQVLATSFEQADRLDDAIKECQQAIALRPAEPGLHQQLGDLFLKGNHLEQAETEFQRELEVDRQNSTAMYKLATVEIERSKPEAAQTLLTELVKAHPDSRETHYQLGRAEAQLGETEPAIGDFNSVVQGAGPADPEIVRQSYYQLSQLYRRNQHPDQAKLALTSFLRLKQQADAQQEQHLEDKLKHSATTQP